MNYKWTAAVGVVLIIAWFGNLAYFQKHQLKEPYFFKHYMDLTIGDQPANFVQFEIHYLTNASDKRWINVVSFSDVGGIKAQIKGQCGQLNQHQSYRKCLIKLNREKLPITPENPIWTAKQLQITYSDGTEQQIPIGEIRINLVKSPAQDNSFTQSSESWEGGGYIQVTVPNSLSLISLDWPFAEQLSKDWKIRINDSQDAFNQPFPNSFGQPLSISYQRPNQGIDSRPVAIYQLEPVLHFVDETGQKIDHRFSFQATAPFTDDNLHAIQKERP